jgi:hypothetical protein
MTACPHLAQVRHVKHFANRGVIVSSPDRWPVVPLAKWKDTRDTLHLWTQIVGKVKLALAPFVNHEDARTAASPERAVYEFLESTYAAGANLANWNRAELEHAAPVATPVRARE